MATTVFRAAAAPPGRYVGCPFTGQTRVPASESRYENPGIRFSWDIAIGSERFVAERFFNLDARAGGALAEVVGQMIGHDIKADEEVDIDALVGKKFDLVIVKDATGKTSLVSVKPSE